MTTAIEPQRTAAIASELDQARKSGPMQNIVIPPCPDQLVRLRQAMAQEDPDLDEVARIASGDVAMSAALMKYANSPLYAAGQPVQTIGQAMNRLGLNQTACVMTGFLAQRTIKISSAQLARFWERATKRAAAMAFMAGKLPGMSADVAYTFGLFCHVGIAVMAQSLPGYTGTLLEALARTDRSFVETENVNHRTDHAVVGALVARTFHLHPLVVAGIRMHHELAALGDSTVESDVHTLIAAGLVAEHLMRRHESMEPDVDWQAHSRAAMDWIQMTSEDLDLWQDELNEILNAV
ncbi:MAG TPA: HDOD domain-containing protein [Aquabacterium sp.]|nr:HDOD domain-containing protein [Aquabacterium sp.]